MIRGTYHDGALSQKAVLEVHLLELERGSAREVLFPRSFDIGIRGLACQPAA
jgi:hypothetical protein